MAGVLLLALVASAEGIRAHAKGRRARIIAAVLAWGVLLASSTQLFGLPWMWGAGLLLAAVPLAAAFTRPRGALVSFGIVVLGVALTSSATPVTLAPWMSNVYGAGAKPLLNMGIDVQAVLVAGALFLFLGDAANTLVRAVLDVAGVTWSGREGRAHGSRGNQASRREQRRDVLHFALKATEDDPEAFKGGRYIGALERWLVCVLIPLGALPVVVALLAAKGIVRFPEVSKDAKDGSNAEYFLVGTLASFGIALAAAGYLALAV